MDSARVLALDNLSDFIKGYGADCQIISLQCEVLSPEKFLRIPARPVALLNETFAKVHGQRWAKYMQLTTGVRIAVEHRETSWFDDPKVYEKIKEQEYAGL